MNTETVDKTLWDGFLNQLSKGLGGRQAEVSVASLDLGSQVEAEWLPFLGMTYDRKNDAIEVILEGIEEIIPHPKQLSYLEDGGRIASVQVVDAQGVQRIVQLKDPMLLPAPGANPPGA
jgi:hypothetical protein